MGKTLDTIISKAAPLPPIHTQSAETLIPATVFAAQEEAVASAGNPVDRPAHYTQHPAGIECIEVIEHLAYNIGAAIKYLWRAPHKDAEIQDLKKARWHIEREIQRLEGAQ